MEHPPRAHFDLFETRAEARAKLLAAGLLGIRGHRRGLRDARSLNPDGTPETASRWELPIPDPALLAHGCHFSALLCPPAWLSSARLRHTVPCLSGPAASPRSLPSATAETDPRGGPAR